MLLTMECVFYLQSQMRLSQGFLCPCCFQFPDPRSFFSFSRLLFLFSMLLLIFFPCSRLCFLLHTTFQNFCSTFVFIFFYTPCSMIIICLLPGPLPISQLAPLCQLGHSPYSGITPNQGSSQMCIIHTDVDQVITGSVPQIPQIPVFSFLHRPPHALCNSFRAV